MRNASEAIAGDVREVQADRYAVAQNIPGTILISILVAYLSYTV
jgi:hypothetical protein